MPLGLAALLDRAIETRQFFSRAISPYLLAGASKTQSDDRHAFFLDVLKSVRDILKPRYTREYSAKRDTPKSMDDVLNMFENLTLEDLLEEFQQAPNAIIPLVNPEVTGASYKAERVDSLNGGFLAFHLLLADLDKLRSEVNGTWEAY